MRLVEAVVVYYGYKALRVYCLGVYQDHGRVILDSACCRIRSSSAGLP
jgi:hypothetical protein